MGGRRTQVGSIGARRRLASLLQASPFSSFPRDPLERLAEASLTRVARREVVLFRRGDPADSAYLIERGAVRLSASSPEGRLIVFRLAGARESLGLLSALDGEPRSADAVAIVDSRLVVIPQAAILEAVGGCAAAGTATIAWVAGRLRRDRLRLEELTELDAPRRTARALIELTGSHGVPVSDGILIDVPLRHEDLAGLVGASRETVTRALASFAERGFLHRDGDRYVLLDDARVVSGSGA